MITREMIDHWFMYHAPNEEQIRRFRVIREEARRFAHTLARQVPQGADRAEALKLLRAAVMFANAGIACEMCDVQPIDEAGWFDEEELDQLAEEIGRATPLLDVSEEE